MDAKCPECERVAVLDDNITIVKCPHCHFEAIMILILKS